MGSQSAPSLTCDNLNQISLRSTSRRVFGVYFRGEEAELGAFIGTLKNICHICESDECNKLPSTPEEGGEEKKPPTTTRGGRNRLRFTSLFWVKRSRGDGTTNKLSDFPPTVYLSGETPAERHVSAR